MNITSYKPKNFEELVDFMARLNCEGAQYIGYLGEKKSEIVHNLELFTQPLPDGFHLAYQDSRLCGALGVEFDHGVSRAWLHGPFCDVEDWQAVADQLYAETACSIPNDIREHEIYCDARNINCRMFAERQKFTLVNECLILCLERGQAHGMTDSRIANYAYRYKNPLIDLHTLLFPNTYLTAQQMLDWLCEDIELFTFAENDIFQGYIFFSYNVETGEGYFDYIGVNPRAQGRGIGQRLILAAIHRCFEFPEIGRITCSVSRINDQIQRITNSVGFTTERTMCVYHRHVR